MAISTNVIDCVHGRPAVGVGVRLERRVDATWSAEATGCTGTDGTVANWSPEPAGRTGRGVYRLRFDSGLYFATLGIAPMYPEVVIVFAVGEQAEDCSVTLLLGPYAYATFRGTR